LPLTIPRVSGKALAAGAFRYTLISDWPATNFGLWFSCFHPTFFSKTTESGRCRPGYPAGAKQQGREWWLRPKCVRCRWSTFARRVVALFAISMGLKRIGGFQDEGPRRLPPLPGWKCCGGMFTGGVGLTASTAGYRLASLPGCNGPLQTRGGGPNSLPTTLADQHSRENRCADCRIQRRPDLSERQL